MKFFFQVIIMLLSCKMYGQELYVFTEPASNMPAKSAALRVTGRFPVTAVFKQRYVPEIMIGINKYLMVHASATFSDFYTNSVKTESIRTYIKYRFLSNEGIHTHFRMAAFTDISFSNSPYLYDDANAEGDNSGAQAGIIATGLFNKLALSAAGGYSEFFNLNNVKVLNTNPSYNFINYSLSAGYLILPREYKNYHQTNLNAYVEMLGLKSLDTKRYSIDFAPAIQIIFNSTSRVNIGYRFQLAGNMNRMSAKTWQLTFEHALLNLWK